MMKGDAALDAEFDYENVVFQVSVLSTYLLIKLTTTVDRRSKMHSSACRAMFSLHRPSSKACSTCPSLPTLHARARSSKPR
jgi:hypothetical protein